MCHPVEIEIYSNLLLELIVGSHYIALKAGMNRSEI